MNTCKKTFSASAILMAAMFVTSCSQEAGNLSSDVTDPSDSPAVETSNVMAGSYVALSSDTVNVYKGDTFKLDITANDFSVSEGGAITLSYDPALVQAVSVNVDAEVWDFVNKNGQINNAEGTVSKVIFSSYKGVSGNAKIATIEFKSVSKGTTDITLAESSANPFASNGEKMPVSFKAASVTVD